MDFDISHLLTFEALISLLTLTLLEIVLGIDNIIFISILTGRLPKEQEGKARNIGLMLALVARVGLLFGITWIISLKEPLFSLFDFDFSGRDIILIVGGLFLLYKSTREIHEKMEGESEEHGAKKPQISYTSVLVQIVLIDIVFSFDSILTAVGLSDQILIMITAVVISIGVMLIFAKAISNFVNEHPTIKMLALSFLLMIGTLLILDGFHVEVPKGYIYFSMAFALFVEMLNLRMSKKRNPVKLRQKYGEPGETGMDDDAVVVK